MKNKQLKEILLSGQSKTKTRDEIPPDLTLANWTRDLYVRFFIYNPGYELLRTGVTLENTFEDRLARLLVGDETVAAVSFDGTNILIATNKDKHERQEITYTLKLNKIKNAFSSNVVVQFRPQLELFYNGEIILIVEHPNTVKYEITEDYDSDSEVPIFQLKTASNIIFTIQSDQHLIPYLPEIRVTYTLNSYLSNTKFNNIELQKEVAIDPLQRRVDHLFAVALRLWATACIHPDKSFIIKVKESPDYASWLEIFFQDSLIWEAAKTWGIKAGDQRNFSDSKIKDFRSFVADLIKDYQQFKSDNAINSVSILNFQIWANLVVDKILNGIISAPEFFIKAKYGPVALMNRIIRYFIDIERIFEIIERDAEIGGSLSALLAKEITHEDIERVHNGAKLPFSNIPKILPPELENEVHAELRILFELMKKGTLHPVGISKLCCPYCNLIFKATKAKYSVGEDIHTGGHGKLYPTWLLSKEFSQNETFMRIFLGDDLYERFITFKDQSFVLQGKSYTKGDLAISIIQSLGSLAEEDLESLGVRSSIKEVTGEDYQGKLQLVINEHSPDLPYEDDDINYSIPSSFSVEPIEIDGNCMFNAALRGVSHSRYQSHVELREGVTDYVLERFTEYKPLIETLIVRMIMTGDLRGITNTNFRLELHELLGQRLSYTSSLNIEDAILQGVRNKGLVEKYILLINEDGFWGSDIELGIISSILDVTFVVHRGGREFSVGHSTTNNVHLRFTGSHYDLLREIPERELTELRNDKLVDEPELSINRNQTEISFNTNISTSVPDQFFSNMTESFSTSILGGDGHGYTKSMGEDVTEIINNTEEPYVLEEIYSINSNELATAITYALSFGIFLSDLNNY